MALVRAAPLRCGLVKLIAAGRNVRRSIAQATTAHATPAAQDAAKVSSRSLSTAALPSRHAEGPAGSSGGSASGRPLLTYYAVRRRRLTSC